MKRLFKFFAVAAIIAVGFTGCTSEEPVGPTGPDDNGTGASTKRGAETYATFKFVAEGATTKASDLGVDNTTNEGTIPFSKVRLTFFDADGFLELDTVITSFGNSATIKLTSGYKQLYVLANETSDLTTALNAVTSINNFNQTFSLD
ncbi:MAG: hypothetical protein LBD89_04855, partial [Tannerellaceae bacterium]|nr:hypothetical protein [Tannerellaceae bacterium]